VEQNAKLVFDLADDIVILNSGRMVMSGSAETIRDGGTDLHHHLGIF
jgi:ABC-type branched-subunit amino acid transport system ATPase component